MNDAHWDFTFHISGTLGPYYSPLDLRRSFLWAVLIIYVSIRPGRIRFGFFMGAWSGEALLAFLLDSNCAQFATAAWSVGRAHYLAMMVQNVYALAWKMMIHVLAESSTSLQDSDGP